jgi:hypothetical protein
MSEEFINIIMPARVWIERHDDAPDARDVIVELEDGAIYTAVFVTLSHIQRQMEITRDFCEQVPDATVQRFAVLDTPHIVVESLERESIEDTVDNLIALETFGSVFTRVTETLEETAQTATKKGEGRRATQEVAAVVLTEVLVVEG